MRRLAMLAMSVTFTFLFLCPDLAHEGGTHVWKIANNKPSIEEVLESPQTVQTLGISPSTTSTTTGSATAAGSAPTATEMASAPSAPVAVAVSPTDATSTDTADWNCIGEHESGNDYSEPGGGRWQFEGPTWLSVTGLPGMAQDYPPAVQDAAALELFSQRGWEPWTTRKFCGL